MRLALALLALAALPAAAQVPPAPPTVPPSAPIRAPRGPQRLSGPRAGVTYLSPGSAERVNALFGETTCDGAGTCTEEDALAVPVVTQFGWQWETRLFETSDGTTALAEWVVLVGGMEQGVLLPSATFLVGVRGPRGVEVGVGPNLSGTSTGLAVALGASRDLGDVALPVNVSAVVGPGGPRLSLLVGVVLADRRY